MYPTSPDNINDRPRLVLILDQLDLGHVGVFLGFEGMAPNPRLCTGDGDVMPIPVGRLSFPAQLALVKKTRVRRWALLVLDQLGRCGLDHPDAIGYLLAARAMVRRLGVVVEDSGESLFVRVLRVRERIEIAPGVMELRTEPTHGLPRADRFIIDTVDPRD